VAKKLTHKEATLLFVACSIGLHRIFAVDALRAALRRGSLGFSNWGVDVLASAIVFPFGPPLDNDVRAAACSVLTEACRYSVYASFAATMLHNNLAAIGAGAVQCQARFAKSLGLRACRVDGALGLI
jgi:hypothetical protein